MATYICDTGFSLVGNSSRTCTGSDNSITGSFDGQTPICEGTCIYIIKAHTQFSMGCQMCQNEKKLPVFIYAIHVSTCVFIIFIY